MKKHRLNKKNNLAARLTGYATSAGALVALATNVSGQVVYSGAQDIELDPGSGPYPLDIDSDGAVDFLIQNGGSYYGVIVNPNSGPSANSWLVSSEYISVMGTYFPMVDGLSGSSYVSSGVGSWSNIPVPYWQGALGVAGGYYGGAYGDFLGTEKYVGVRFHIGPNVHYGWIRASMGIGAIGITIHDWAYEATPLSPIITADQGDPVPLLTPSVPVRTNIQTAIVNIEFIELISGLDVSDFVIVNGTAGTLTEMVAGKEYQLEVTADVHGMVDVTLPAGSVADVNLDPNVEASTSWFYDDVIPLIDLSVGSTGSTNNIMQVLTIDFSEQVLDMELTDVLVTNGTAANLVEVAPNKTYTVEITAAAEGTVAVEIAAGSIVDYGNNPNGTTSTSWIYDATAPVATLTPEITGLTNLVTVELSLTFDEEIEGLDISDLVVTNGTAANLVEVTAGLEYTVDITATAEGAVDVELPLAAVTDLAGNENAAATASWELDSTVPVATLDAGLESTNTAMVVVDIDFSEEVAGLEIGDLVVTNGTAANLVEVTPGLAYTVEITAAAEGSVSVELAAAGVADLAGNDNAVSSVSWMYDLTGPEVTFAPETPELTNLATITISFSFDEEVTGLELGDISATNGTVANLTEITAGEEYSVDVTATAEGEVTLEIAAAAVMDAAGNASALATVSYTYDLTVPTLTLDAGITAVSNLGTVPVSVVFSEEIEGLAAGDFVVTNGTASNLVEVTAGVEYTIDISPSADGEVSVELPAAAVADLAGNDNTVASTSWMYDGTAPVVAIDFGGIVVSEQTNTVNISFNESVTGFTIDDITVTNGSAGNLTEVTEGEAYTVDITAAADGDVTVEVVAGAVSDEAGNENVSASVSYAYGSGGDGLDANLTEDIRIYPNPSSSSLNVELEYEATVRIISATGKLVMVKEHVVNEVLDVSNLPQGVYIMQIENSNGTSNHRIVIE